MRFTRWFRARRWDSEGSTCRFDVRGFHVTSLVLESLVVECEPVFVFAFNDKCRRERTSNFYLPDFPRIWRVRYIRASRNVEESNHGASDESLVRVGVALYAR